MMKLFLLSAGYIPSAAKGHPISKWQGPQSGHGIWEVSSSAEANTSPPQLGPASGDLHSLGMAAPFRGCSLPPTVQVT